MITKKQYVEYLLSTPEKFTCTHMADHLDGVSHDVVNDFLQQKRLMPRQLWALVKDRIDDGFQAFLIADDSVQDIPHSGDKHVTRASLNWSRRNTAAHFPAC